MTMTMIEQPPQNSVLLGLPPDVSQDNILDWDEGTVHSFFSQLGYPYYKSQLVEHGITGEILVHLDHQGLKDVGIHSVGQRLAVLKGVYTLKLRDDVPIEEGHWVPPLADDTDCESPIGAIPPKRLLAMFRERDDRIILLESRIQALEELLSSRNGHRSKASHAHHASSGTSSSINTDEHHGTSSGHGHPFSPVAMEEEEEEGTLRSGSQFHQQQLALATPTASSSPNSPAASPGFRDERKGLKNQASHPNLMAIPQVNISTGAMITKDFAPVTVTSREERLDNPFDKPQQLPLIPTLSTSFFSSSSTSNSNAPPTTAQTFLNSTLSPTLTHSAVPSDTPNTAVSTTLSPPSTANERPLGRSVSKHSADNPYKSFRVTLDDPCFKVLPAALKKYKINDDWRQYALFILFGPAGQGKDRTERCLAYDEKPLLLFQRLKETEQNPVFMLRHVKDIKSPIAVAAAKLESKKTKKTESKEKEQKDKPAYSRANRLHHAPAAALQPVGDPGELLSPASAKPGTGAGMMSREQEWVNGVGGGEVLGYCLAIYPYVADRDDEFDVAVGDTFAIVSKSKGWWVVYRDNGPAGPIGENEVIKSAWVPAGCLLETAVAPLLFATPEQIAVNGPANARNVLVPPISIVSVSTPGVALLDYKPKGSDEVEMKKDERVRVYKRYNHWSYLCNESTGERGWVPSWFVGKISTGGTNVPPTPTVTTSEVRQRTQDDLGPLNLTA